MVLVSWHTGGIIEYVDKKLERKISSTFLTVNERKRHPSVSFGREQTPHAQ